MKISLINGGLGNQTFQYIFARFIENATGDICFLDDSDFFTGKVHNGYELEKVFPNCKPNLLSKYFTPDVWGYMIENYKKGVSIPQQLLEMGTDIFVVKETEEIKFSGNAIRTPLNQYIPEISITQGNVYYYGYWINKNWFTANEEKMRKELEFPPISNGTNAEYLKQILSSNSVGIHIRRGDFITAGLGLSLEWYKIAIQSIKSNMCETVLFFVFSDEVEWCKEHIEELGFSFTDDIVFVEGNYDYSNNYIDMQLMSSCKHLVIANSSFSYLAALLNTRKQLVLNPLDFRET